MSLLCVHVHAAFNVHAACPCPCCISLSMLHVTIHAAFQCPSPCLILHVLVHGACPCPCFCCMNLSMVHVHVYGAYPHPCYMSMSMGHIHLLATCPIPCRIYVHGHGHPIFSSLLSNNYMSQHRNYELSCNEDASLFRVMMRNYFKVKAIIYKNVDFRISKNDHLPGH